MGLGNMEAAARLHERYGKKVSLALCGPVGEYGGLLAGIAISDTDLRPTRLAARGGVGAVMGAKKVKVIVAELNKMPALHDRKKVMSTVKEYGRMLREDELVDTYKKLGHGEHGRLSRTTSAPCPCAISARGGRSAARSG